VGGDEGIREGLPHSPDTELSLLTVLSAESLLSRPTAPSSQAEGAGESLSGHTGRLSPMNPEAG
jgi:hypothetical protein